jgi:hypothetical protein
LRTEQLTSFWVKLHKAKNRRKDLPACRNRRFRGYGRLAHDNRVRTKLHSAFPHQVDTIVNPVECSPTGKVAPICVMNLLRAIDAYAHIYSMTLKKRNPFWCDKSSMRVGMISMRHPDMDSIIDRYWFRNIEVSQSGMTNAETDELCYQITLRKLQEIRELNEPTVIAFYQTGMQQALVGFLRGLVEFLRADERSTAMLEVVPYFWVGEQWESSEILDSIRTGRKS